MKKRLFAFLLVIGAAAALMAVTASAETRLGGYFSLDYLKGKAPDPYAGGSIQNFTAGLLVSGEFSAQITYALEIQAVSTQKFEVQQAWAAFLGSDAFRARVGLFLVPFGKTNESARAFQTRLVQAPLPVGLLAPASWRELGVMIEGRLGPVVYASYLGNGLTEAESLSGGQQFKDNNRDKGRGGRIGLLWGSNFEIGASTYAGKVDDAGTRSLTLKGFDATWSTENIRLAGEYAKADIANPAPFAAGSAEGWFVELALKFGEWTPLAAYQKGRTDDPYHGPGFDASGVPGAGVFERRSFWAVGLVYALHPNVLVKGEYDFSIRDEKGGRNAVVRIQAAAHF
jgi:hypothetical protein